MNVKRWESVKDLLHQAMQLAPEQRGPFLEEVCSSDVSLRAELESLLCAEEDVRSSFMQSPPLSDELINAIGPSHVLEPGQVFSQRFQLVRKLGEGGMGQVWLAEQTSPVRRQVALKLIKAGMYDEAVLQRFQSERQSLAIMDHPAIAKVFDAGTTEQGQPYFVMEYVPGLPITEYCDQNKLTIRQRLELFIQACEGVQHAHQKAIIHRDLKPANILVVEVDGRPVPRIIDFGLAKAISSQGYGESVFTQLGSFVGTPGYMSPEQTDPEGVDIDTRTDVYSLGVVLYVLLTGFLPLDTRQQQPLVEVLRKLREDEPARPSTKVRADRESSTAAAAARATEPAQLVSLLRGDLDWIAMKALEKDRARRYGTPSELAADIQRYLNHEPVVARPASAGYRLQKYVRRHRAGVIVAASLVLLLAGFAVLQAVQLRRITHERDRANRERDRATRVTDFMTNMFQVSDPSEARGNTVTAREVLDKASREINTGLTKEPEVQAQMMYVMGRVYEGLGLYPKAASLLAQAADIRSRVLGPANPDTLATQNLLGFEFSRMGRYAEAEKLLSEAFARSQEALGRENPTTLALQQNLAVTFSEEGRYSDAEKLSREVLDADRRIRGLQNPDTVKTMFVLCAILGDEGKYDESEKLNRETLDLSRRVLGPEHPETIAAMDALASTLSDEGHYAEAEQLTQETLEISRRVNGVDHPQTATLTYNLACLAALTGQPDRALFLLKDSVDHGLRVKEILGMDQDPDLKSLYGDSRFQKIVADAKQRVAALQKSN
jgi:non-specific serine/threonine protein kinase/serine/threonine-protein kinase